MDRLLVAVLGHRNSGKSKTWDTLFGHKLRTGLEQRSLKLAKSTFVNVFVVSGSPEERHKYVGKLINKKALIVLCSVQYRNGAQETFDYFISNGYKLYVQWINPGYKKDILRYPDHLGLFQYLQHQNSIVSIRDGKHHLHRRVRELREFIHGWAASRRITYRK